MAIVAGDVANGMTSSWSLGRMNFTCSVLAMPGNHDYYGEFLVEIDRAW